MFTVIVFRKLINLIIFLVLMVFAFGTGHAEDGLFRGPIESSVELLVEKKIAQSLKEAEGLHKSNLERIQLLLKSSDSVRLFFYEAFQFQVRSKGPLLDDFLAKHLAEEHVIIESQSDLHDHFKEYLNSIKIDDSNLQAFKVEVLRMLDAQIAIRSTHPSITSPESLSNNTIDEILSLMSQMTAYPEKYNKTLSGKTGGVFSLKPSTRTRTSSERALLNLGAKVISLSGETSQHMNGEPLTHSLLAMSGSVDVIFFRGYDHSEFVEIARDSRVPLINALTNDHHPLQAIADAWVLLKIYGKKRLRNKKLLFRVSSEFFPDFHFI